VSMPFPSILYDYGMTYIVGMIADDGIIFGSDGLVRRANFKAGTSKLLTHKRKLHKITSHLMVGFSGNGLFEVEKCVQFMRDGHRIWMAKTVKEACNNIRTCAAVYYHEAIALGYPLELVVAGYNLSTRGNPTTPELYYIKLPSITQYRQFCIVAGTKEPTHEVIEEKYLKGGKNAAELVKLTSNTIDLATIARPNEVGGETYIYHLTKRGIKRVHS
jgi:20S proteasome alpha/beta subunit